MFACKIFSRGGNYYFERQYSITHLSILPTIECHCKVDIIVDTGGTDMNETALSMRI